MTELHIDLAETANRLREQREEVERRRLAALDRLTLSAKTNQDVADILTLLQVQP
jgi:hypothetical protein